MNWQGPAASAYPRGVRLLLAALALVVLPPPVRAQWDDLPPGFDRRARVVRSMSVQNADAPIWSEPSGDAIRLGTIAYGTRVHFDGYVAGTGCDGRWFRVDTDLFMCDRHVQESTGAPRAVQQPVVPEGALLPMSYAFVAFDGTRAWDRPEDTLYGDYVEAYGRGFGVVTGRRRDFDGQSWTRLRRGLWVTSDSLRHARGSEFRGVDLSRAESPEQAMELGWIRRRNTAVRARRGGGRTLRRLGRREVVHVVREERAWAELRQGGWVRLRELHRPRPSDVPDGVGPTNVWIDVQISQQTLVVYRGERPLYATVVSTGRDTASTRTPIGDHRIWVKLAYSDMDNLARTDLRENYAINRVPWVQYFAGSNGLHAAFWHDDFGRQRSHGCVNLSPTDARIVFDLSEPQLPAGWSAIFAREQAIGSVVRIRE